MSSPGVLTPAFPPPLPDNQKSLRFYEIGTCTANFVDNQFAFERVDPKDPAEPEQGWASSIRIHSIGASIEWSLDGVNVHGFLPADDSVLLWSLYEGGIAVRGVGADFRIEAW